jgi:hypothetical protein
MHSQRLPPFVLGQCMTSSDNYQARRHHSDVMGRALCHILVPYQLQLGGGLDLASVSLFRSHSAFEIVSRFRRF